MRILEHRVTSVDTVQSLAQYYLGDAALWRDIVDFNNLDYPYISSDPNFVTATPASGTVTCVRSYPVNSLFVPKGTIFAVPPTEGYPSRTYATLIDYTFAPGQPVGVIPIQCTVAGIWGDVSEGAISTIVTTDPNLAQAFSGIANMDPISNGDTFNVRLIGDSILIPTDGTWDGIETYGDITHFYESQFGTDLSLGADGDLIFDGYGAVGTVTGINNLAQACRDILITPRLSLVYHPDYGSILDQMVGRPGLPYAKQLIGQGIIETLVADDRVDHVNVLSINQAGTDLNVVIDVYPIQGGDSVRVPLVLPNISIV